ncbi:MAG: transposase [Fimbriimonadaceae bacterium]
MIWCMEEPRQRHWRNRAQGGDSVFITTTCLDFVHALDRMDIKDAMCQFTFSHCKKHHARLAAFVVMSHHLHLLVRLGEHQPVTDFMREFKRRSSSLIRPMLARSKDREFDMQRGLNRNAFWQRSFRSVVVLSEEVFRQEAHYIHLNPVRAELVAQPDEYRWSSAWIWNAGLYEEELGLPLDMDWPSET